jgi:hypothetical protein
VAPPGRSASGLIGEWWTLFAPGSDGRSQPAEVLRAAIVGRPLPADADVAAIANEARRGEVTVLAAKACPVLAEALEADVRRQAVVDLSLGLLERRLGAVLDAAGVGTVALLKGSVTARTLYDAPGERFRKDVDALVAPSAMARAVAALEADGWTSRPNAAEARLGPGRTRTWTMTIGLPAGTFSADLHQTLFPGRRFKVDPAAILRRARPAPDGIVGLALAAPEDTLLHLAVHTARAGFHEPMKGLVDLHRYVARAAVRWDLLARRAVAWRAAAATWACLRVVDRWFGTAAPAWVMRALRPPWPQARLLAYALSGDGPYPLRRDVTKWAAAGATGPLISDGPVALARYVAEVASRRGREGDRLGG